MKVVVNRCYGGFGLSLKGLTLWCQKKDYSLVKSEGGYFFAYSDLPFNGGTLVYDEGLEDKLISDDYIDRNDLDLVAVVEELGVEANGDCASLRVVEIPDDVAWHISNYDGMEHVAENHRTW